MKRVAALSRSLCLLCLLWVSTAPGATTTWTGGGDGTDWFDDANWDNSSPTDGDAAVIASGSVLLTNDTAIMSSFTITNATLTFTNWNTSLSATNVVIQNSATITLPGSFTDVQMSNRVHIVCSNLIVASGATIDVNAKGYAGSALNEGYGPGKGFRNFWGGGAGYGGRGGEGGDSSAVGKGGQTYGLTNAPTAPGSGGARTDGGAGSGGGAVKIDATGDVTIDGAITANGANGGGYCGGGSGGAVFITCNRFGGSGGILRANGGNGGSGGGGGGRLAVDYQTLIGTPSVQFSTSRGTGVFNGWGRRTTSMRYSSAEMGTIYFSQTNLLSEVMSGMTGYLVISNFVSWSPANLTVSNDWVGFGEAIQLTVSGALVVKSGGALVMNRGWPELTVGGDVTLDNGDLVLNVSTTFLCGGDMVVTNSGEMYLYSGTTNGSSDYGGLVSIAGDLVVAASSWIYPNSHPTNGGSLSFRMSSFLISENGGLNADGRGYAGAWTGESSGQGPGRGSQSTQGGGGGYGGVGGKGKGLAAGGGIYGLTNAPIVPGSGGARPGGGSGGGAVWLDASGAGTVDGTITANGANGRQYCGAGSGGGIFITCATFQGGSNGVLRAKGGNGGGDGGGGGGGRITVAPGLSEADETKLLNDQAIPRLSAYAIHADYLGSMAVTNGTGYYNGSPDGAEVGTKRFLTTAYSLTVSGTPGNYDSPSPDGYGTTANKATNSWVTNTVTTPADEVGGVRYACLGWDLTNLSGSVTSDIGSQATFQMTTNMFLTWHWTNEYQLTVSASVVEIGSVNSNTVNGWYTNGLVVTGVLATASNTYTFSEWTGSGVPSGMETNNPLTVTMDQARTIVANFNASTGMVRTWNGVGNWESATNWTPNGMPSALDDTIIESGSVTIFSPRSVTSLTVSNAATVVFTNWSTKLTVSNDVTVLTGGTITLPGSFTDVQMSNRVHIVCSNLIVASGATINVNTKGYAGATVNNGYGPGKGLRNTYGGGGGYGGSGGEGGAASAAAKGGQPYGLTNAPTGPGSGGARVGAGSGGGAVRIDATGDVTIDGAITANGSTGAGFCGGGSGGAVLITCNRFGGSGGILRANGGNGGAGGGGGGGGGRLAVDYQTLIGTPSVQFSTARGTGVFNGWGRRTTSMRFASAEMGTIYFSQTNLLSEVMSGMTGYLVISNFVSWSPANLTVSNDWVGFGEAIQLTVSGALVVKSGGALVMNRGWPELTTGGDVTLDNGDLVLNVSTTLLCGGDMTLSNGGKAYIYSGTTNGSSDYGGLVSIAGNLIVGASSWIYPNSHPTNGGSLSFRMSSFLISENGGFNADGRGYAGAWTGENSGQGAGGGSQSTYGGGGGYGGVGGKGKSLAAGGGIYGLTNAPIGPGSGGARVGAGSGGGAIWLDASGAGTVDGTITANGANGRQYSGAGSGGGIFINCVTFQGGSNGVLRAKGGNGGSDGGGGGGGRIAVWYMVPDADSARIISGSDMRRVVVTNQHPDYAGSLSVTNGTGYYNGSPNGAEPGTALFITVTAPSGTIFIFR